MTDDPTFNLFLELPKELQIRVWWFALPGGRIIQVYHVDRRNSRDSPIFLHGARHLPLHLSICQTSREVARSTFKAIYNQYIITNKHFTPRPTYLDFTRDTIYLTTPCGDLIDTYQELARLFQNTREIESLAITVPSAKDHCLKTALNPILRFSQANETNLREIVVIVGQSDHLDLAVWRYPEKVRFFTPEVGPLTPWNSWKDLEAHWTKELQARFVVRFMEVKIIR